MQKTTRRRKSTHEFIPGTRTKISQRQARPVLERMSMHVVMRSSIAKGRYSLLRHQRRLDRLVQKLSERHGVRIYKLANVGNHIHIHLRVTQKINWKGFISGLAGGIARSVGFSRERSGVEGMTVGRGFWDTRPFSRSVGWGRDFRVVTDYLTLNQLEAAGLIPSRKLMRKGACWRRIVALMRDELGSPQRQRNWWVT